MVFCAAVLQSVGRAGAVAVRGRVGGPERGRVAGPGERRVRAPVAAARVRGEVASAVDAGGQPHDADAAVRGQRVHERGERGQVTGARGRVAQRGDVSVRRRRWLRLRLAVRGVPPGRDGRRRRRRYGRQRRRGRGGHRRR